VEPPLRCGRLAPWVYGAWSSASGLDWIRDLRSWFLHWIKHGCTSRGLGGWLSTYNVVPSRPDHPAVRITLKHHTKSDLSNVEISTTRSSFYLIFRYTMIFYHQK
jgi:hypothetical protein